jgi:hypothetical protein
MVAGAVVPSSAQSDRGLYRPRTHTIRGDGRTLVLTCARAMGMVAVHIRSLPVGRPKVFVFDRD